MSRKLWLGVGLLVSALVTLIGLYLAEGRWFDRAPSVDELTAPSAWTVQRIDDGELSDPGAELHFEADGGLTLTTACRTLTGEWLQDTDGLAVGVTRLTSPDPPCPGSVGDAERLVQGAFDRLNGWVIRDDGCSIEFYGQSDEPLSMWLNAPCA